MSATQTTEQVDAHDAHDTASLAEFRARARAFRDSHAGGEVDDGAIGAAAVVERAKRFQAALYDAGLAGITFPTEFGGAGLTADHQRVFNEEFAGFAMPSTLFMIGLGMCAPTLLEFGTDDQRRRHLRGLLRGDQVWCQLFSEPGAGSDVASLQTKAVRDGEEWLLNGQKVWTSVAHFSDFGLCVARTNPDVPKHRGISMFIVDMHAPGVVVKPLRQMNGDAEFNEVFLDDVRLPADALLGPIDEGWRVAVAMLANERVAIGAGDSGLGMTREQFDGLLALARERGVAGDVLVRQDLVDIYVRERILALLALRIRGALKAGRAPGPEGSVAKLATAILGKRAGDVGAALAGPAGVAWAGDRDGMPGIPQTVLSAPMLGIAGGTSEIQRNIIGERVLGLPKEPQVDRDVPFRELKVGTQRTA
jgi:alkylation response protein AidB-like acyl-CoA dehydrogenase